MVHCRRIAVLPFLGFGQAANIFVYHYSGTTTNLNFDLASDGTYSLSTNGPITIGGQPSWMNGIPHVEQFPFPTKLPVGAPLGEPFLSL